MAKQIHGSEELTFTFDRPPTAGEVAELIWKENLNDWKLKGVEVRRVTPIHQMGLTFGYNTNAYDVKFRKDRV